ncbi:hypothetical protein ES705_42194 [subsurface metagenome]
MLISKELKELVEQYVSKHQSTEVGGVFIGDANRFDMFVPIPNVSVSPSSQYEQRREHLQVAQLIAEMISGEIVGGMHTHPSGTVVSEADLKWLESTGHKFGVVVACKDDGFEWFCLDKKGRNQPIYWTDEHSEMVALLLAKKMGLNDLGRVMITPSGELLCEGDEAKELLMLDRDVYLVKKQLEARKYSWQQPTRKELSEKCGLSAERVRRAMKKIG